MTAQGRATKALGLSRPVQEKRFRSMEAASSQPVSGPMGVVALHGEESSARVVPWQPGGWEAAAARLKELTAANRKLRQEAIQEERELLKSVWQLTTKQLADDAPPLRERNPPHDCDQIGHGAEPSPTESLGGDFAVEVAHVQAPIRQMVQKACAKLEGESSKNLKQDTQGENEIGFRTKEGRSVWRLTQGAVCISLRLRIWSSESFVLRRDHKQGPRVDLFWAST